MTHNDNLIYIYGDSHGRFNFSNLPRAHVNKSVNAITMHRIGRDQQIVSFDCKTDLGSGQNVFFFAYGEIDCRCHIKRRLEIGEKLDDVIDRLASQYLKCIEKEITLYKAIIVCAVNPTTNQKDFEAIHGCIDHEFNFQGTDEERILFTTLLNEALQLKCQQHNFLFFNVTDFYKRPDGTLNHDLGDKNVHILNNAHYLIEFEKLLLNMDL